MGVAVKALSPRMLDLLQKLHAGGVNDKVHWIGGIEPCAFVGGSMQTVTTTVLALQGRGLVGVVFNNGSLSNGTVDITKAGIAYLKGMK